MQGNLVGISLLNILVTLLTPGRFYLWLIKHQAVKAYGKKKVHLLTYLLHGAESSLRS